MLITSLDVRMVSKLCCFHIETEILSISVLGLLLISKYKKQLLLFLSYLISFELTKNFSIFAQDEPGR